MVRPSLDARSYAIVGFGKAWNIHS